MKYIIRLVSRYTGQGLYLGSTFSTKKEAEEYDVCKRCNRVEVMSIPSDYVWKNKDVGFVSRST